MSENSLRSGLSLLRVPRIRRIVTSYVFSSFGSAVGSVAIAFLAYHESDSVVLTALVLAGNTLPFLVLAPVTTRLFSRFDVRFLLVASMIGKALIWTAAAVLSGVGALHYGLILGGAFLYGSLSTLSEPTWPRLMESIAPPGRLTELNALTKSAPAPAWIVGAVVGGILVASAGPGWALAIDAASYLPCALVIVSMPRVPPSGPKGPRTVRGGAQVVLASPRLRHAFLLAGALNLAAFPVLSTLPAVAAEIEPTGHPLGYLHAAFYLGTALVAFTIAWLRQHLPYSRLLAFGFFIAGIVLMLFAGLTAWRDPGVDAVAVAAVTLLPVGLALTMNAAILQSLVQLETKEHEKGSVIVLYATVIGVLTPLGGIAIGFFADAFSLWWSLAASGLILAALAVILAPQLEVFDELDSERGAGAVQRSTRAHWGIHLRHTLMGDVAGADQTATAATEGGATT